MGALYMQERVATFIGNYSSESPLAASTVSSDGNVGELGLCNQVVTGCCY